MTKKFRLALVTVLFAISFGQIQQAHAGTSSNSQLQITTPSTLKMNSDGCTSIKIQYKIQPNLRNYPGFIKFRLEKTSEFADGTDGVSFGSVQYEYNIDMDDLSWVSNNADFFGSVPLEFCSYDSESEGGATYRALKSPGTYYVTAHAQFNTFSSAKTRLTGSFISTTIKITGNGVKSTILCRKDFEAKEISALNPKCPKGWVDITRRK